MYIREMKQPKITKQEAVFEACVGSQMSVNGGQNSQTKARIAEGKWHSHTYWSSLQKEHQSIGADPLHFLATRILQKDPLVIPCR